MGTVKKNKTLGMIYKPKQENILKLEKWIEELKKQDKYKDKLRDL